MKAILLGLLLAWPAFGVYNVGDTPKDECWDNLELAYPLCLSNATKHAYAQVLIYNAGWCGPCNAEFKELVPLTEKKFVGKEVAFISLSAEGWTGGSKPDAAFLKEWSAKHGIDKTNSYWHTAASPRDAGRKYFNSPSIPNVVVLDKNGKVAWKAIGPSAREVAAQVEKVLK